MTDIAQRLEYFRPPLYYPEIPYHRLLKNSVQKYPNKEALIFKGQSVSFLELDALSNSLGRAFAELGVRKGERVSLYMTNRAEYVMSFYAAAKIGAVVTPMNPSYKEGEVEHQLNDSEAVLMVTQESLYPIAIEAGKRAPALKNVIVIGKEKKEGAHLFRELLRKSSAAELPDLHLNLDADMVALPYSSGTTGLPKGVILTHKNLVTNNIQMTSAGRLMEKDVPLIFLPFYHIYGTMLMGGSIASGATMVIMESFDLEESLNAVEEYGVTLYYAVPPILLALSSYPDVGKRRLSSIRYLMVGAAPVVPEVVQRVQELTGLTVLQGYGLTEASPMTHLTPPYKGLIKLESAGLGVSDQEQKIVDVETGTKQLGVGEVGELIVKGPHVMKGYWKGPEETANTIRDGWLFTGDIARLDEDGYIYIVDRKKEMIKYKGFSVAPAEIEAVIFEHPAVADCAVIGKQDPEAGEIPKALVVPKKGEHLSPQELMDFVAQRVAGYKKVREVELTDQIPKNPSGKILRRVLKDREQQKSKSALS